MFSLRLSLVNRCQLLSHHLGHQITKIFCSFQSKCITSQTSSTISTQLKYRRQHVNPTPVHFTTLHYRQLCNRNIGIYVLSTVLTKDAPSSSHHIIGTYIDAKSLAVTGICLQRAIHCIRLTQCRPRGCH